MPRRHGDKTSLALADDFGPVANTPAERHSAALTVVEHLGRDAGEVLAMLALDGERP